MKVDIDNLRKAINFDIEAIRLKEELGVTNEYQELFDLLKMISRDFNEPEIPFDNSPDNKSLEEKREEFRALKLYSPVTQKLLILLLTDKISNDNLILEKVLSMTVHLIIFTI